MLIKQGWTIVARNFRWIGTELDILARKGDTLIAVEVKFRSKVPPDMASMESMLPHRKINALKKGLIVAQTRLTENLRGIIHSRIDLALVTPAAKMKTPPAIVSGGAGDLSQGNLAVRWFTAIGG